MTNENTKTDLPSDEENARKDHGHMEVILPEQGPTFVRDETVVDYRGELLGNKLDELTDEEREKYTITGQDDEDIGGTVAPQNKRTADEVADAKYFDTKPESDKDESSKPAKK